MLNVIIPKDNIKLDKQIAALEWQIKVTDMRKL